MKNFSLLITTATFVALLAASASIPSSAATRQRANAFDGDWSVMIYTESGDCPQSLRYGVRVWNGRVLSEDQNYQVNGTVAPNGATRVTVSEGGRAAGGSGRLSGNQGWGRWRTFSGGQCAGQWRAERRAY
jgi:hypothetical protein